MNIKSRASNMERIRAEAAAWIARLHGPNRTEADDRGFQAWLSASPDHGPAFEQMTDVWETSAGLKSDTLRSLRGRHSTRPRIGFVRFSAAALMLAMVVMAAAIFWMSDSAITTGIGEQRVLALKDGTRITLNTATRLKIHYTDARRGIELESGEALFEVAKRPGWPFVVSLDDRQVTALGTTFVVRHDARQIAVTLIEGKVQVVKEGGGAPQSQVRMQEPQPQAAVRKDGRFTLTAGQRVTFEGGSAPKLDKPEIDKLTAWKLGLVELDNSPLSEAVDEMNRYSVMPLTLKIDNPTAIRVSGVFRAGDSLEFARAVSQAYGLAVEENADSLVLRTSDAN